MWKQRPMVGRMMVAVMPIMPLRFKGAVAVAIGPMGMASAIGYVAIAAIAIGRAVMATAGKAAAQRQ
jgi:hypothetical protein